MYHTVFDISDRFPDLVVGVLSLGCLMVMLVLWAPRGLRGAMRRWSCIPLGLSGVLWALFAWHNIGGLLGLEFAALGLIPVILAVFAWIDYVIPWNPRQRVRARSVAPFMALGVLVFVSVVGCAQWPALQLNDQLGSGHVQVVSGTVTQVTSFNWETESFVVGGHAFRYSDAPTRVGFHQTAAAGGPIREGLEVRVTYIGDDIVRLEIADGQ